VILKPRTDILEEGLGSAGGLEEGVDGPQDKTPVHKGGGNDVARLKTKIKTIRKKEKRQI
jgi:hypothetical protein